MNQIMALKGGSSGSAVLPVAAAGVRPEATGIEIEIRLLSSCAEIRQAWSDLAIRALEPNLFFEPDFALAAAQHLVAFRNVAVILAWQGAADDQNRRLVGLIPCFARNRLFVPDQLIGFSDPRLLNGAPLLDAVHAQAVVTAVMSLRQGWVLEGRGLVLRRLDLESPLVTPLLRAAERLGLSARLQPVGQVRALAPTTSAHADDAPRIALARQGRLALVEASARSDVRDAVEHLLAMDASGQRGLDGKAVLQDTREAGFLRAMTRALARGRQCRVGLLTLDGQPIAGAIVLGRARRRWLYMSAQDEHYAPFEPGRVLLAMLRTASPAAAILDAAASTAGSADSAFGELRLLPQAALKPRDLASRAREALHRGFRIRRAAIGG